MKKHYNGIVLQEYMSAGSMWFDSDSAYIGAGLGKTYTNCFTKHLHPNEGLRVEPLPIRYILLPEEWT